MSMLVPTPRLLAKKRRCPSSERFGAKSAPGVLMTDPRFPGVCQAHAASARSVHSRCATQMSSGPAPSARLDVKYSARPSGESVAFCSFAAELIVAPRFTGADQGVPSVENIIAVMPFPGAEGSAWDPGSHAASSASAVNEARMRDVVLMGPPSVQFPPGVRVDIQISVPPKPPDRLDAKSNVRPPLDRLGCCSAAVEVRGASRFTGGLQGSCTLRRVDVHRSAAPTPPGRVEKKNTSLPSERSVGPWSVAIGSLSSEISTAGPRVSPSRVMATE